MIGLKWSILLINNKKYLKRYIKLENGIPSHNTISRVFSMLQPDILQQLYRKWQELLNKNEGEAYMHRWKDNARK